MQAVLARARALSGSVRRIARGRIVEVGLHQILTCEVNTEAI